MKIVTRERVVIDMFIIFDNGYKHDANDLLELLDEIDNGCWITNEKLGNILIEMKVLKNLGYSAARAEKGENFDSFTRKINEMVMNA